MHVIACVFLTRLSQRGTPSIVAILCVAIPHVAHGKLHEICMLRAMRKRGLRKRVTGMCCRFLVASRVDMQGKMKL